MIASWVQSKRLKEIDRAPFFLERPESPSTGRHSAVGRGLRYFRQATPQDNLKPNARITQLANGWRQTLTKNVICLWYDGTAEQAARFYAQTFPNSAVTAVHRAPGDYPNGKQGQVLTVEFTVVGVACVGLNGGPAFKHNEAFSFQILTDDQTETDRYWNAIVGNGGAESACGWCKDKWGLSWQITPRVLLEATTDPDRAAAKRAFEAMMKMKKIDIAMIQAARQGLARP
jgi:predicted 3-demethylubiquinone-9 3-methyltransferase (glyoxalase superfamily)